MKKVKIVTYGCQMNVNDSAKYTQVLNKMDYTQTDKLDEADLILLNTCTVRESAVAKIFGKIGEIKALKRENKDLILVLAGCVAQEKKEDIIKKFPYVDIVMGNQNISQLPELISKIISKKNKNIVCAENIDKLPPRLDSEFSSEVSGFVSIMYGCNNFCTYCIVPYVRGRERSVPVAEILTNVQTLLNKNYKEITLLGQNVNSYFDKDNSLNFSSLLEKICKIEGDFRIRFVSPHPRDFTDELIDVVKDNDKICNQIHLPLQAGSTTTLKAMNRGYTKEQYLELAEKIRRKIPNISISTDIIVGFPKESYLDFQDTIDVVKKVRFENAYMFMYSKRTGTPAEKMENQILNFDKKSRLQELMELQNEITNQLSQTYIGKTLSVLVEGTTKKNPDKYTGRNESNRIVIFNGTDDLIGKFVNVKIKDAKTWTLYGDIQ